MRVLLDTNVVLDFILKRPPFDIDAKEILVCAARKQITVYVSPITPINAFYKTRKEKGKGIAFQAIEKLLKIVHIAKSNNTIYQNALSINFNDYEDAVQHECAVAENLDAMVTRNVKDYKNAVLKVYSPTEFLQVI